MLALALFSQQALTAQLDAALQNPLLKGCSYSVYVTKLDGTVLYDRNSEARLVPASNEKLFTTAYALHDLGLEYHPTTRFWKMGDRVIVDTTGDPMLKYGDLVHAKDELKLTGSNPVYVREPYRIGYLNHWNYDDLPNKYAAPVTGFTVDQGGFELWADSKHVYFQPNAYGTKVLRGKGSSRSSKYNPFQRTVTVNGPLPNQAAMLDTLSLPEPDRAAASILGNEFHETEQVPSTDPDLVLEGPVLPVIVKECLVHSYNNLAENLLLLTAMKNGPLGEDAYLTATSREKEFLVHTVGIEPDEIHPDDGCGLSRHNWATTHAFAKLLQWESSQPTFTIWKQSLASPGNGTLKSRLSNSSFVGKTGSMTGVTALSGYITGKGGQTFVVSMLFNFHLGPNSRIQEIEDQIIGKIEATPSYGMVLDGSTLYSEIPHPNPSLGVVSSYRVH
jgi:D-alanyl-D-alanine carboxypeptidase/D-alanyl-D-alanine-endopeptidase (penicillin-binding protein 4)